jgi:hypothetical protein
MTEAFNKDIEIMGKHPNWYSRNEKINKPYLKQH